MPEVILRQSKQPVIPNARRQQRWRLAFDVYPLVLATIILTPLHFIATGVAILHVATRTDETVTVADVLASPLSLLIPTQSWGFGTAAINSLLWALTIGAALSFRFRRPAGWAIVASGVKIIKG
jgi:hypothetical protein